ncbi:hypothetical protein OH77DRAFT_309198 [Trametes cingulata]|nr:hypothetical protein OH77DRAFT_309198 [Trametes cingulata]
MYLRVPANHSIAALRRTWDGFGETEMWLGGWAASTLAKTTPPRCPKQHRPWMTVNLSASSPATGSRCSRLPFVPSRTRLGLGGARRRRTLHSQPRREALIVTTRPATSAQGRQRPAERSIRCGLCPAKRITQRPYHNMSIDSGLTQRGP